MLATRSRSLHLVAVAALIAAPVVAAAPAASAAPAGKAEEKVRICHRTNSLTNPYTSIEVARSSVDGTGGTGDHYLNHTGAAWTSTTTKQQGWGDIIPPIDGVHGGLNWTGPGQAIWSSGCQPANEPDTDGDLVPDMADTDDDGDLVPDVTDPDDDGDGTSDTTDPDQSTTTDTDGDTVPDPIDGDDDGDGIDDDADPDTPDPVTPTVDLPTDTDRDGTPDAADPDEDGDTIPNAVDPDQDGDGNPDVSDPDDDNDGTPDVDDSGDPEISPPDVTDTDNDGNPDATDRDDDGDGVPDVRDGDADGNGTPETRPQPISTDTVLEGTIPAGEDVLLVTSTPMTASGAPAGVRVACRARGADVAVRSAWTGDVAATRSGCDVNEGRAGRVTVEVTGTAPVVVELTLYAPAVGDHRASSRTITYVVTPA